ncbi:MAG: hypothetical protein JSV62_05995 [Promethearchaeota archaeon]|nr:MAG: hypothetical protein JSV62_05995 [Candidatus Lokiarchaeota archaeon]
MSRMERRVHEQYPEAIDRHPKTRKLSRRTRIVIKRRKSKKKRRNNKS